MPAMDAAAGAGRYAGADGVPMEGGLLSSIPRGVPPPDMEQTRIKDGTLAWRKGVHNDEMARLHVPGCLRNKRNN